MGDIRRLLNPKTIAIIGATEKEGATGRIITENILPACNRQVYCVNPYRDSVLGLQCYPDVGAVPEHIDLAIVTTPAATIPEVLDGCGRAGVDGAIIISAGFRETGPEGRVLEDRVSEVRERYGIRVIGPNCLGIVRPHIGLNATFLKTSPEKGKIAFVSQSGAFGRALLDWGISSHIGFSMFASLGSMIDVDFADLIDFLGDDPQTRSIMIYVEGTIGDVKKFTSAARGFARNKPIIVLRPSGLVQEVSPALSHTGTMAGREQVYDAVFKRIGVIRVRGASDLFSTASVLYSKNLPKGPRLHIISNAAGVGVMAANTLLDLGGELAKLSEDAIAKLDALLPPYWNRQNPIDILRDADAERFVGAMDAAIGDTGADGLLVIYTPEGAASSEEVARAIVSLAERAVKPVVATFIGGGDVRKGREILTENNIPIYDMPEEAVSTYLYMYRYERNLELLYETPAELPVDIAPPKNNLKALIRRAVKRGVTVFTEEESTRFLINYGIPIIKSRTAHNVEEAIRMAAEIGYPVALKVSSPDVLYRIDLGGVITEISSAEELTEAYNRLLGKFEGLESAPRIAGVTIQKMLEKIDYEVILGAKRDPEFGSVILFGSGGVGVNVFKDFSIGLPPLNQTLARRLMEETLIYKALQGYRGKPPADLRKLEQIIVSFSNLIVDFPEIVEMDVNPIAISDGKAYALDARIIIDERFLDHPAQYPHLVIAPYPTRYITPWSSPDGTSLLLRPIKPEDEPLMDEMYAGLSEETFRARFFQATKRATHEMHIRQCSIDYDREMGIVAELRDNGRRRIVGIGTLMAEPGSKTAEYAVLVRDDFHGKGLGYKLVDVLIGIAQEKGLESIYGIVISNNNKMLNVCRRLGFTVEDLPDRLSKVVLTLR